MFKMRISKPVPSPDAPSSTAVAEAHAFATACTLRSEASRPLD